MLIDTHNADALTRYGLSPELGPDGVALRSRYAVMIEEEERMTRKLWSARGKGGWSLRCMRSEKQEPVPSWYRS